MKYLKVFVDFAKDIEGLSDTEAGRLFRAMLKYADTDEEPNLRGVEKILWPVAKKQVDNQREAYKHICEVNKKNAANRSDSLRTVTNGNEPKQEKEKEKDNITPLKSFVRSICGRDDEDGLERMISGLHLDLYEGGQAQFVKAVENAIRTMWRAESIKVCGQTIPQSAVRDVLRALTIDHIDYLLAKFEDMDLDESVTNGQAYLISCIYNAQADCAVNGARQRS